MKESYLGLLSLLEESLLTGLGLGLVGGEVLGLRDLLNLLLIEAGDIDLVRGGDDVARVDPSERDAVDLERSGDEEDTLVEGLDENDALAAEATGQEDQDGTGLEGLAGSPGADSLANLRGETLLVSLLEVFVCFVRKGRLMMVGIVWTASVQLKALKSCSNVTSTTLELQFQDTNIQPYIAITTSDNHLVSLAILVPIASHACERFHISTHLLGLALIVGRVPLLGLLGGSRDVPGALAELLVLCRHDEVSCLLSKIVGKRRGYRLEVGRWVVGEGWWEKR